MSLKLALERLLGAPCYHMLEVFGHPDHVSVWHEAAKGSMPDWDAVFEGYAACVDWPAAAYWREISEAYPDAPVLLSVRDPNSWWASCNNTIFEVFRRPADPNDAWRAMADEMLKSFGGNFLDPDDAKAAFERHNAEVRSAVDPGRLVEWRTGDGWEPICTALGIAVPDEPFPHTNTTEEFRARAGFDATS
jgi:hypothetical protein